MAFGALCALGHALCLAGIYTVVQHHGLEKPDAAGPAAYCSIDRWFICGLNIETLVVSVVNVG